ncbi:glycosyltransferase family 2 protein [Aliivibrio sp. S3MY1]|uniref:glycosyltransferase family 2 protein n=1 Tax=unclassified Aliivibrio TaxID=2645654 RepID=UPI0023788EEF|nr:MULTISPECIES: glycosyltransferase family 2 protein [unclassified Aliivibrio]MDD9196675.1 glycosyltransferase family 2 protein [Aliivibrio sp. S3MY1]MDD9199834.1 glycosyltransferase family 2 protein [Aliivibrio sp. S2MY1]
MSTPTLAVALIVKNEAKHLQACLETVQGWVDEIVILDSGSTDETEIIARQFTDRFFVNSEWPGFGKQRQLAQQYVTAEYVLWLDADERVTPELKEEILTAIKANKPNVAYKINRLSSAFGKFIKHSGWSPDWVVRLYRTNEAQYNDALVHEKVVTSDSVRIEKLKGRLLHFTYDNLHHYINKTTGYLKAWTDEREGKKKAGLSTALIHALGAFLRMYVFKRGFLDGKHGFILAWLTMHTTFIKYIDLYLREEVKKK